MERRKGLITAKHPSYAAEEVREPRAWRGTRVLTDLLLSRNGYEIEVGTGVAAAGRVGRAERSSAGLPGGLARLAGAFVGRSRHGCGPRDRDHRGDTQGQSLRGVLATANHRELQPVPFARSGGGAVLVATPAPSDRYAVLSGEHRLRAGMAMLQPIEAIHHAQRADL